MTDKKTDVQKRPEKITAGMDYELNREATKQEKQRGDTTRVTTLSWDEVDND